MGYAIASHDKTTTARRIAAVCVQILEVRTGGAYGGRTAEVAELARELGCNEGTVWDMLRHREGLHTRRRRWGTAPQSVKTYLPRLDVLMRLCQVAGVSADWLLFGTGRAPRWWRAPTDAAA